MLRELARDHCHTYNFAPSASRSSGSGQHQRHKIRLHVSHRDARRTQLRVRLLSGSIPPPDMRLCVCWRRTASLPFYGAKTLGAKVSRSRLIPGPFILLQFFYLALVLDGGWIILVDFV